jgi:Zn-finger nucleic acid-binding protein
MACRACHGLWVEESVLDDLVREISGPSLSPIFTPRGGLRDARCPTCAQLLHDVQIDGVPLDRCPDRHGVWFDARELEAVLYAAGSPPRAPHDRGRGGLPRNRGRGGLSRFAAGVVELIANAFVAIL